MALCEEDIQQDLERRRSGKSRFTSQRKEPDKVRILSGVFEGVTVNVLVGVNVGVSEAVTVKVADGVNVGMWDAVTIGE